MPRRYPFSQEIPDWTESLRSPHNPAGYRKSCNRPTDFRPTVCNNPVHPDPERHKSPGHIDPQAHSGHIPVDVYKRQAIAYVLFIIIFLFSALQFKVMYGRKKGGN